MKWGTAPVDPQATNKVGDCNTVSSFAYLSLTKAGITRAWYIIAANVETYKKANANWSTISGGTDYAAVVAQTGKSFSSEITTWNKAKDSVYVETN